jgi:hypothetical protein
LPHEYLALLLIVIAFLIGKDRIRQFEEGVFMPALLLNNAVSRLAGSLTIDDLQLSVSAGDGAKFPTPGANEWFPLTLVRADGSLEILCATDRNGDVITVLRAQETTAPLAFSAGDRVELRATAEILNGKLDKEGGVMTGPLTLAADLTTYRPAAPTTGAVFLGNSGSSYLFFDGTNYSLGGAGTIWSTSNFNPASYMPLTGANFTGNFGVYNTSPTVMFYDTDWGPRQLHCNGGLIGFLTSGGGWGCYSNNDGSFIASGNIGAYSDRKHKKQIRAIQGGLALVENLRGVRYIDRRTGDARVGVIAQEVRKVLPEVVGESPDGLYVDYGNIVAALIPAIQELSARLKQLERA